MTVTGTVFNIERFSSEDGPGIRTVVFLKGCSLRCVWCANPESQARRHEILHKPAACADCGRCLALCPEGAIRRFGDGYIADAEKCRLCQTCVDGCYAGAREKIGEEYDVDRLLAEVMRDAPYFRTSGGGVTFSGGEPLLQADFVAECATRLKAEGINILIETCGNTPTETFKKVGNIVDFLYYDFKHIDSTRHRVLTGTGNETIVQNLRWLNTNFNGFLAVRYPYIPGKNDASKDIEGFIDFVAELDRVRELWFLPYHRLGRLKYHGLGLAYEMDGTDPLRVQDIQFLRKYEKKLSIPIRV